MKRIFSLIAMLFLSCNAAAFEVRGNTYILSDQEVKDCAEQGGCALITAKFRMEIAQAIQQLSSDLDARVCRRMGT